MEPQPGRDPTQEPLAALERLFRKNVITQQEGEAAARLLTGDPNLVFPPPPPAPPPVQAPPEPPAAPREPEGGAGPS